MRTANSFAGFGSADEFAATSGHFTRPLSSSKRSACSALVVVVPRGGAGFFLAAAFPGVN